MTRVLTFVVRDLRADRRRSVTHIGAIVPIVAAYLILIAIAGGLRGEAESVQAQDIVLLSPNALDPASGRLDPSVLDLARDVGGEDIITATPMIFRPIRMADRVVQLRAAPFDTWQTVHDLTLLSGSWPDAPDEVAITEGIAIATDWTVGTRAEIFGTQFEVSALVRAPGTKFASVWMTFDRADRLFEGQSGFQMVVVEPAPGADVQDLRDRLDAVSGSEFSVYFEADLAERQSARQGAANNLATVATLIGIAALAFGGFNLSALALAERTRDLGIARAVGFTRSALRTVAVARSTILAAVGFVLGGLAALAALSLTTATTLRSFVFEPSISGASWLTGATITIVLSAAGAWIAFDRTSRVAVRDLLDVS
jgi:hypothetical protein